MAQRAMWEEANPRTLDVAKVVELEQAIAADGTSLAELMDHAGAAVTQFVESGWLPRTRVVMFCGKGNNGGDGWVAAQLLTRARYHVTLVTPCEPGEIRAHPAREAALRCMEEAGDDERLKVLVAPDEAELGESLADAGVIVDAMLGTGFHYTSLHEPTASWVAAVVRAREGGGADGRRPFVIAVDVPSGLNAQTGEATCPVVHADATITMMAEKTGMATSRGRELCGELHIARIAPIERFM